MIALGSAMLVILWLGGMYCLMINIAERDSKKGKIARSM
jgi:hypothetical protein